MNNCLPSLDELFEQVYTAKPLQASHLNHKEKFYITNSLIWAVEYQLQMALRGLWFPGN